MGKEVADVALRLWTPQGAEIQFVKQVAPTVEDLTGRRTEAGPRAGDYPTGSWGDESRDYHVCVEVPAAGVGQEMLAARVSLVAAAARRHAAECSAPGPGPGGVDRRHGGLHPINPQVAHYTGQAELAQVIQQGLEARKAGDVDGATAKLGRAVQLASASGNEDTAKLLAKVVDVVDAATGTVRLKAKVADADEMTLETRSTKTVRVKKIDAAGHRRRREGEAADMPTCPNGHQSASDDWCEVCGIRMSAPPSPSVPTPPPTYPGGHPYGHTSGHGPAREPEHDPGHGRGRSVPRYDPDATAAVEPCPECGTPREGHAQFCEECRYNFAARAGTAFVPQPPSRPGYPPDGPPYQRYESQRSRPSQINRPAEPLASESVTVGSGDFLLTPPDARRTRDPGRRVRAPGPP